MTTTVEGSEKEKIENRIAKFDVKTTILQKHQKLSDKVKGKCEGLGYTVKPIGSATKNPYIPLSDIDLLGIQPVSKHNLDAATSLQNLQQELGLLNPKLGNHSVIIKENGLGIDVVPARKTKLEGQYMIPTRRSNSWIVRGHDQFAKDFRALDNQHLGKLSSAVKILKTWKNRKTTLDISSLSIEKVCVNALKQKQVVSSHVDAVLLCFAELTNQITQSISHPGQGPQLNELTPNEQKTWKGVIKRDLAQLKTLSLKAWEGKIGPEF